jgi:hypothetical protein
MEIRDIRFSRRMERQCDPRRCGVPALVVCDAIANGARLRMGRGPAGGVLVRFERSYPVRELAIARVGRLKGVVAVLAEITAQGCVAQRLLSPARGGKKTGMIWDF